MAKKISPSMETYLETIKEIEKEEKVVRVKGIARRLHVKMPSVTEALQNLCGEGLIRHEKYGYIELTKRGNKLAQAIDTRHRILFSFFTDILGTNPQCADDDACKIEHVISDVTLRRLVQFVRFIESSLEKDTLLEHFREYSANEEKSEQDKK